MNVKHCIASGDICDNDVYFSESITWSVWVVEAFVLKRMGRRRRRRKRMRQKLEGKMGG